MTGHDPACQMIRHIGSLEGCELLNVTHYRAPGGMHHTGRGDCPQDLEAVARSTIREASEAARRVELLPPRLGESTRILCDDPTCSVCGSGQAEFAAMLRAGEPVEIEPAAGVDVSARRRRYPGRRRLPGAYELRQLAQLVGWLLLIAWLGAHW